MKKVTLRVDWAKASDPDGLGDRIYNSHDMLSEGFVFIDKPPKGWKAERKGEGQNTYYVDVKTMTVDGTIDD